MIKWTVESRKLASLSETIHLRTASRPTRIPCRSNNASVASVGPKSRKLCRTNFSAYSRTPALSWLLDLHPHAFGSLSGKGMSIALALSCAVLVCVVPVLTALIAVTFA